MRPDTLQKGREKAILRYFSSSFIIIRGVPEKQKFGKKQSIGLVNAVFDTAKMIFCAGIMAF